MAAATVNAPPGAVDINGAEDPFTGSPYSSNPGPLRYAAFDNDQFSLYSTNSPASARHALEAHLKDTDRRIQDASRLGTTLVQQRRELASKLKEVEQMQQDSEVPAELHSRLTELEREYNEVGRESARAFLPKSRVTSETEASQPGIISGSGRESPTKISAPSRRQRNQPTNRVHDIEFATEISTSLLAQVRQLQSALAEKDQELKETSAAKANVESESAVLLQKVRHYDDSEQKYKDENWNLETRLQEMEANLKQTMDRESRLTQNLKSAQSDKAAKERELDDLKATNQKLIDDGGMAKKVQDADLNGLRRDAMIWDSDKQKLQRKIEELTAQNTELARAVSFGLGQRVLASDTDFVSAEEGVHSDDMSPDHSAPPSPIKGTPARHGMLESETLKSSLNHAHRMIQNLKNNIHREKTEKIELKRMLQDARDELEQRRETQGVSANVAKKRRSELEGVKFKRPSSNRLGAARSSTTEIIDEPDWEDQDGEATPSRARTAGVIATSGAAVVAAATAYNRANGRSDGDTTDAFETANETDTGFETATERGGITESDAFATGAEDWGNASEGDVTETEATSTRKPRPSASLTKIANRMSYMSTASTSGDEDDGEIVKTPVHSTQQPKYKLRLSRVGRRSGRVSDIIADSPQASNASPSSSNGTPQPTGMQSLGDELDALDEASMDGTPVSSRYLDSELDETPVTQRQISLEPDTPTQLEADGKFADDATITTPNTSPGSQDTFSDKSHQADSAMLAHQKPEMVDAAVMTDPWEPERIVEKQSIAERAAELAGGALAGFGLSRIAGRNDTSQDDETRDENISGASHVAEPVTAGSLPAATVPKRKEMTNVGTDPRGAPPTTNSGTDARIVYTSTTGTDALQPFQTNSIGIETERELEPEPKTLGAEDLPSTSTEHSPIISQVAESEVWPLPPNAKSMASSSGHESSVQILPVTPPMPLAPPPAIPVHLAFSQVVVQEYEPIVPQPRTPLLPRRSSRRLDLSYAEDEGAESTSLPLGPPIPSTDSAKPGTGFFASETSSNAFEPTTGGKAIPSVTFDKREPEHKTRQPLGTLSPNVGMKSPVADEGSQTLVSGDDIDSMLRNKTAAAPSLKDAGSSPFKSALAGTAIGAAAAAALSGSGTSSKNERPSGDLRPSMYESPTLKTPKRPASAGSIRGKGAAAAPPLPTDVRFKIAAARHQPSQAGQSGTMGPPIMPASAYKRPNTPGGRPYYERPIHSRDSTTPRPIRMKDSRGAVRQSDRASHRGSVSSFASELDERFNITRGQIMYPADVEPSTDPRMIQAITQTMIGEYLWKYTRKAGRSETSSTRHRRFFWVHPYTRTLYWSEQDPSTAGKNMLKAKSVAIESVRVISDDNAYPPGLHRKSLVVITPGREIVFTAPTGQRHETWFNALSYLLLRTEREKAEEDDEMSQGELDEFRPGGFSGTVRRSISRIRGGTTNGRSGSRQSRRTSLSSYNSRTTRNTSPPRNDGTVRQRQSASSNAPGALPPGPVQMSGHGDGLQATSANQSRQSSSAVSGSMSGRLSSMASRLRPGSSHRAQSAASMRRNESADPAAIYDASVVADSAEDLRAVIERQEQDADRLENVRACCDGKHDVGSLNKRNGKHSGLGTRFASHGHGHHSHAHGTASSRT